MDYEIFIQAFNHEEQKQGGGGGVFMQIYC